MVYNVKRKKHKIARILYFLKIKLTEYNLSFLMNIYP